MLKPVTIAGHEVFLHSADGRNFFQKPAEIFTYRRERAALRERLRKAWGDRPMHDLELPHDTFPCGAKI